MVPIVGAAAKPAAPSASRRNASAAEHDEGAAGAGRALVPVAPIASYDPTPLHTWRPAASFLAHLIAAEAHIAQTRERRRAEPSEAIVAYANANIAPSGGGKFFRSV